MAKSELIWRILAQSPLSRLRWPMPVRLACRLHAKVSGYGKRTKQAVAWVPTLPRSPTSSYRASSASMWLAPIQCAGIRRPFASSPLGSIHRPPFPR